MIVGNFLNIIEFKSNGMSLYEISTEDKQLRSCSEYENVIRSERGDSELSIDKIMGIIEMPESYKNHFEVKSDALLSNNPYLKKYAQLNPFNENAIEYNLQPINPYDNPYYLENRLVSNSNYANDLYSRLPLSIYDNYAIRDMDNYSN
jgi:hypothetical protein